MGDSYSLGERFSACFVLKFALQRGREIKGGNIYFKTKHSEPLTQEIPSVLYMPILFYSEKPRAAERAGGRGRSLANYSTAGNSLLLPSSFYDSRH